MIVITDYKAYKHKLAKQFKVSIAHWTRLRRYVKRLPKSMCNKLANKEKREVGFFRDVNLYLVTEHGEAMGGRYCPFCVENEFCDTCPLFWFGLTEKDCVDSPYSALIYASNKSEMVSVIGKELKWLKQGRKKIYKELKNEQVVRNQ